MITKIRRHPGRISLCWLRFFLTAYFVVTCWSKSRKKHSCSNDMTWDELQKAANEFQDKEDSIAARKCFAIATSRFPHRADAWYSLAQLLYKEGRLEDAIEVLENGVRAIPRDSSRNVASLLSLLAQVHEERGDHSKAEESYRASTAMEPGSAITWYNQGYHYMTQNNMNEALKCFLKAVELRPDFGRAVEAAGAIYFGTSLHACYAMSGTGEEEKSIPYFYSAVKLLPQEVSTRLNLANALGKTEKHLEAVHAYKEVLKLDPDHTDAASKLAYFSLQVCDWKDYNTYIRRVLEIVKHDLAASKPTTLIPWNALIMPVSIQDQLAIAKSHARRHAGVIPFEPKPSTLPSVSHRALRIGYFSADYRNHPMGRDLSVLLPAHSKTNVSVFCYAQNPPHPVHDGEYRAKFEQGVHRFRDVNPLSDQEAAQVMAGDELDVAVDLMGYTHGGRDGIFAHKPARVQIAFKGYMSTSGAAFIGHLVSDIASVPVELTPFYSERQLLLDPCFVVFTHAANHPEVFSQGVVPRSEAGLPAQGFVFCSFNSLYKITPTLFLAWIKILNAVPRSVLWLLREPSDAEHNLLQFAKDRGLDPSRVRFTHKVDMSLHLLHKGNCQLFLDTPLYNAHSTAADALWAGIPMVTVAREKMAGRVAASLALALHLPQMVARTLEEYSQLAILLATRPSKLRSLRAQLLAQRGAAENPARANRALEHARTGAVFDIPAWMDAYEQGLRLAVEVQTKRAKHFHILCKR